MVFGVAQVTTFFEENNQMGLSQCTRLRLQSEGTVRPKDLIEFTLSDSCNKITKNCKSPSRITDTNNAGQKIAQKDF